MQRLLVLAVTLAASSLVGCAMRAECINCVAGSTTSDLGSYGVIERCGIGHCMTLQRTTLARGLKFRLPTEPGTVTLEELEATSCTTLEVESCEPITGTMVVREVHPPAEGQPIGRLDADVVITSSVGGKGSVDYRERFTPMCHDVYWPDIDLGMPGPE